MRATSRRAKKGENERREKKGKKERDGRMGEDTPEINFWLRPCEM